ncbi:MAG: TlpA family protein disulfide reductase [Candidatus Bilamarchaeum sp.]|jgi:thiol-disulfide isomerase/thioredoxin
MKSVLILLMIMGIFIFGCVSGETPQNSVSNGDSMQKTNNSMINSSNSMNKTNSSVAMDTSSISGYQPFSIDKYNLAKEKGKYIFLEFYASWCPTCISQKPHLQSAFSDLSGTNSKVVGFQVNYRDDQTDQFETDLARELGISTQHTHIILSPNGTVVLRSNEMWNSNEVKSQISRITG